MYEFVDPIKTADDSQTRSARPDLQNRSVLMESGWKMIFRNSGFCPSQAENCWAVK